MFYFNDQQYRNSRFNYVLNNNLLIKINSPLDVDTYIERIKEGKEVEGTISVTSRRDKAHIELSKNELLKVLYSSVGICPKFVDMEEYNDKSIAELKILSNQVIWSDYKHISEEDIRNFFAMSKYSQETLKESGFSDTIQTYIMKALSMLYRENKMQPEYSIDLNRHLHNLYSTLPTFEMEDISRLINLYYKAPFLSEYIIELPRDLYQLNQHRLISILDYINSNELIRDELNTWAMEKKNPEQIDIAIKIISKIFDNYSINYDDYQEVILYMEDETKDKDNNIFVAPDLQSILQEKNSIPYTYWHCPQLQINGTLDEPNIEKLQKFVDAINKKIENYLMEQGDMSESYQRVTIHDIDPRLLKNLQEQDGEDYEIEDNFEKAIKELLIRSKLLRMKGFSDKISIIEEDGKKYSTPYGDIYKCRASLKHRIERTYHAVSEAAQYAIYSYKTNRHTIYYRTSPDVVKNMGLMSLREAKEKAIDGEMLEYIKDIQLNRRGIDKGLKESERMLTNKTLQFSPITEIKESYVKLKEGFKERFGRIPRIMPQIAATVKKYFEGKEQEFIDNFNYKNIGKIIGEKTPAMIRLSSVFNWSETPKGLQEMLKCYATSTNVDTIIKNKNLIIECYKSIKEKELIAFLGFIDRVNSNKIVEINKKIENMYNETNNVRKNALKEEIENDIKNLITESKQEIGKLDAIQAEEDYNYKVINNSSELLGDNICVMSGQYRMYFINSMDYEHFSVGYDTSCCQHYDGAAEQCVIAASSSPHCGTLVVKTHDGVTKAQAFVWEALDKNGDKVLVLDNIEFANDKEVKDYLEILYAFCKESPYQTIHMGLGFNEKMSNIGKPIPKNEIVCRPTIPFMDNTFNYSDYKSAVYLKKDGEIMFESDAKYYRQTFNTPSIIETNTHAINIANDGNALIAQHYNVYYDNCGKTTQVINKNGELVPPTQYPLYPFESTHINPENHIMKWDKIESTDFAITITKTREDMIVIKPIALDGKEIPKLNENQARTIMQQIEKFQSEHPSKCVVIELASSNQPIEVQSIYEINLMEHNNYICSTPQGDTLYCKELISLPQFDNDDSRNYDSIDLENDEWDDEWDNFEGDEEDDDFEEDERDPEYDEDFVEVGL